MRWRETATLIWSSSTRRLLTVPPGSRRTAIPSTTEGPEVRAAECGTPVQVVGGQGLVIGDTPFLEMKPLGMVRTVVPCLLLRRCHRKF